MIDNVAVGRHIFNGTRRIPADGGNKNKIPVMSIWLQGGGAMDEGDASSGKAG
jgi:hypothetical protein